MKRFHLHVSVKNIPESIQFYSALFGVQPTKVKADYAKWMLDDPRLNFAISNRSGFHGIDHVGIQVDRADELQAMREKLAQANITTHADGESICCYAKSEKYWVQDPNGIAWEAYKTMEDAQMFRGQGEQPMGACCAPSDLTRSGCSTSIVKSASCC